jgi:MinD superfamily P-loop ATPase
VNSAYYAEINAEACVSCGVCADERCQIEAIQPGADAYEVIRDKCIGCGLCATTCPSDAIRMVRKNQADIKRPPQTEKEWFQVRGQMRA